MRFQPKPLPADLAYDSPFEKGSGVYRCVPAHDVEVDVAQSEGLSAEGVARRAMRVSRTCAAVLLVPGYGREAAACVTPGSAGGDASLVMRLATWLRAAGEATCISCVPTYVNRWFDARSAVIVPIQTFTAMGWVAVPLKGMSRDRVRALEALASSVALELEQAERRARLTDLSAES